MGGKGTVTELMNQLVTKLFVEQPLVLPGSAKQEIAILVGIFFSNSYFIPMVTKSKILS